jgi:hypothetical protein
VQRLHQRFFLVQSGWLQPESRVLKMEHTILIEQSTFAQQHNLATFGQGATRHAPFFQRDTARSQVQSFVNLSVHRVAVY